MSPLLVISKSKNESWLWFDLIFQKNPILKISKADLKKLFQFATSGTNSMCEGKFYNQIDDVAMGSTLGSVLVNLFIGYYEQKCLQ